MSLSFIRNFDPDYFNDWPYDANCGSYAFNICGWYDADCEFEDEVGDVGEWIKELSEDGLSDFAISEIYAEVLVEQILKDFYGEVRLLEEIPLLKPNEELIAFRTFCTMEDTGIPDFDYHFKVYRDGHWKEKCGASEVSDCTLENWNYEDFSYISPVHFFTHQTS